MLNSHSPHMYVTHTYTDTHIFIHTHIYINTHTHTHTQRDTHTHVTTHIHTVSYNDDGVVYYAIYFVIIVYEDFSFM